MFWYEKYIIYSQVDFVKLDLNKLGQLMVRMYYIPRLNIWDIGSLYLLLLVLEFDITFIIGRTL